MSQRDDVVAIKERGVEVKITNMNVLPVEVFMEMGFLQEVNREFFHPLGLALRVRANEDGRWVLDCVADYMSDPEGVYFDENVLDPKRARMVADFRAERRPTREKLLGYWIQPVSGVDDDSEVKQ